MRRKRIIGVALSVLLAITSTLSPVGPTGKAEQASAKAEQVSETKQEVTETEPQELPAAETEQATEPKDGTYKPNQVIIEYSKNALPVKQGKKSLLQSVRKNRHAAKTFGRAMRATGDSNKAATTFAAQTGILSEYLGDDFVIEDTLCVGKEGDLVYSLVSSTSLSTKEMIRILKGKEKILAITPNTHIRRQAEADTSYPDYSRNDTYASAMYQQHSPEAKNTGGHSVYSRGYDAEKIPAQNLSIALKKTAQSTAEPEVVAVVDTGIYTDHEDLCENLWENPGNIGLMGDHGYDFLGNSPKLIDDNDHGTHCSGTIAARVGNGIGVAGASDNKVKLMGLRILGASGTGGGGDLFDAYAAFCYIAKAKENGVNIHLVNNSWVAEDSFSTGANKDIFEKMYKLGITLFFAAGNSTSNLDAINNDPANTMSDNLIVVGALREDGEPTSFSNFGNETVDLYTSGQNILSSVAKNKYLPVLFDRERLAKTTEYYGEFSSDMIGKSSYDGKPVLGDDCNFNPNPSDVKTFDAPRFYGPSGASMELSASSKSGLSDSAKPASLSLKIKGLKKGSTCYVWFPYKKSVYSNGKNTYFSILYNYLRQESNATGKLRPGEIVKKKNGQVDLYEVGSTYGLSDSVDRLERSEISTKLMSYDESISARVDSYGIGFKISDISLDSEEDGYVTLAIDSLGVSKPDVSENDFVRYNYLSGTSMACPSAVGFASLVALMYPEGSKAAGGKKGKAYVDFFRNKIFSLTTHSEKLEGLCRTEGYLDFRRLENPTPVIDQMKVNTSKKTITLTGTGLDATTKLFYKRIIGEGEKTEIPIGTTGAGLYAVKNKSGSITIKNAGSLIGTYTRMYVETQGLTGTSAEFIVDGEKTFTNIGVNDYWFYSLLTDKKGSKLYAITNDPVGELAVYKPSKKEFTRVHTKSFAEQLYDFLDKKGVLAPTLYYHEDRSIKCSSLNLQNYSINGINRRIVKVEMDSEFVYVLMSVNLNKKKPKWEMKLLKNIPKAVSGNAEVSDVGSIGKYLYVFGGIPEDDEKNAIKSKHIYRLDTSNGKWKKMSATLPVEMGVTNCVTYDGAIYLMAGTIVTDDGTMERDPAIYKFDGTKLTKMKTKLMSDFRGYYEFNKTEDGYHPIQIPAFVPVKNGILIHGISVDGYGNTFIYNPKKDKLSPVYATIEPGLCSGEWNIGVVTKKGFYVGRKNNDDSWNTIVTRLYLLKPGKDTFTLPTAMKK
ncbi:MAG: S8 family serine peptidase [Eubacterium sp.]|nr:S8 family serine peptidase [Eubacterium sp.]